MPYQITSLTALTLIQEVCRLVGHPRPTDALGSTDSAVQQMVSALNQALSELLTMYEWQDVTVKDAVAIVADSLGQQEKAFDLPDDFHRFIDQTQWGQSSMLPAMGPVSPQSWMLYTVRSYSPQLTLSWQMRGDQLWVLSPPYPDPVNFEFMYISKGTVIDQDDATVIKNVVDKNGDSFILDDNLLLLLTRSKYLEWKGFDSEAATRDFLIAFNSRTGSNKGAPVLNIGSPVGLPLIDPMRSLPDTGYGS